MKSDFSPDLTPFLVIIGGLSPLLGGSALHWGAQHNFGGLGPSQRDIPKVTPLSRVEVGIPQLAPRLPAGSLRQGEHRFSSEAHTATNLDPLIRARDA